MLTFESRNQTFITKLCLALAHKWEPDRVFMIFTAYMDESNTHGEAPDIIMAGFIGHAYQWNRLEKSVKELQKRYGFNVLHARKLKKKEGDFARWSDDKCMGLVNDTLALVDRTLTHAYAASIPYKQYVQEYKNTPFPKGMSPDSHYGLCFRVCLGHLMDVVSHYGKNPKIHVVLEAGHKNAGDASRIFYDIKKMMKEQGNDMLQTFTTALKEDAIPLWMADFIAHTYSMMKADPAPFEFHPEQTAPRKVAGKSSVSYVEPMPGELERLKAGYELVKEIRQEIWRAKRRSVYCD